jgi:hypothetical protein
MKWLNQGHFSQVTVHMSLLVVEDWMLSLWEWEHPLMDYYFWIFSESSRLKNNVRE